MDHRYGSSEEGKCFAVIWDIRTNAMVVASPFRIRILCFSTLVYINYTKKVPKERGPQGYQTASSKITKEQKKKRRREDESPRAQNSPTSHRQSGPTRPIRKETQPLLKSRPSRRAARPLIHARSPIEKTQAPTAFASVPGTTFLS